MNNVENLKRLIDTLKTFGFWQRLFGWTKIKMLLVDAMGDLQKLLATSDAFRLQCDELKNDVARLHSELQLSRVNLTNHLKDAEELRHSKEILSNRFTQLTATISAKEETIAHCRENFIDLEKQFLDAKKEIQFLNQQIDELKKQNTSFAANEANRKHEHEKAIATLSNIQKDVSSSRQKELEERHQAELQRRENLRFTWSTHQTVVRETIKSICNRHTIEYLDSVPFKGSPDNTLKICEEYIIFDAKSPQGEDLTNFPRYLNAQAESARKYAMIEGVKKWIFLVVPSNALHCVNRYVYHLADYEVFVIPVEALEPVILSLKKVEDYDFAEQLSPEDRENICRVLGKFAHLAKRRIQIDSFFIKQFMELAYKAESDLPSEILEKVVEFEKAEKLNPPTERRKKLINLADLDKDASRLRSETAAKGISMVEGVISTALDELPLYSE